MSGDQLAASVGNQAGTRPRAEELAIKMVDQTMYRFEAVPDSNPPRLCLEGDVDLAARDRLVSAGLGAAPIQGGVLVIDLTDVACFDSWGARAVLELRSALARRGTKLRLRNVPPCVARTFRLVGVPTMVRGEYQLS